MGSLTSTPHRAQAFSKRSARLAWLLRLEGLGFEALGCLVEVREFREFSAFREFRAFGGGKFGRSRFRCVGYS